MDTDLHTCARHRTAAADVFQCNLRHAEKYKQASIYVYALPFQNNASALGDPGLLFWLARIPVLISAGLENSTWLNSVNIGVCLRQYMPVCAAPRLR